MSDEKDFKNEQKLSEEENMNEFVSNLYNKVFNGLSGTILTMYSAGSLATAYNLDPNCKNVGMIASAVFTGWLGLTHCEKVFTNNSSNQDKTIHNDQENTNNYILSGLKGLAGISLLTTALLGGYEFTSLNGDTNNFENLTEMISFLTTSGYGSKLLYDTLKSFKNHTITSNLKVKEKVKTLDKSIFK